MRPPGTPVRGLTRSETNADIDGSLRLATWTVRQGDCIRWTGTHTPAGYGQVSLHGKRRAVHRVAYELAKGAIPPGLEIDHLCRVRDCINPDHLEAVTHQENLARVPLHLKPQNNRRTHCRRGHPFSPENTYVRPNGTRHCRACRKSRSK